MPKVGIHTDLHGNFCEFLRIYEQILEYNGISCVRLDIHQEDFWEKIGELDYFIFRFQHTDDHKQLAHTILPIIEHDLKIKCFPDQSTSWHFDDKVRQYYLLSQHGFPYVQSHIFWDRREALKWVETARFPLVFKLRGGAGSQNVLLVNSESTAKRLIRKMFSSGIFSDRIPDKTSTRWKFFSLYNYLREWKHFILHKIKQTDRHFAWQVNKNYALFQEFMPGNDFDTRVTVIGNRAFAFRRMNRTNDFRSSGSGLIDYDPKKIDLRFIEIAFEVSKTMKFQSMAYDFLYDREKQPAFCEISYTFVDTVIKDCPGYWDSKLQWHEGHLWPQYCQLVDLLDSIDLKQP